MRALSFQAAYACRHSGACCRAGWIEPDPAGRCRFHDAHPSGGCTIQRDSGHAAIPHACQQFPRVATLSPLGASVTLSAFCPTAASLLFETGDFSIVETADRAGLEGLDARDVLPPLLRPGMLMDWPAVARWEELAIAALSRHRGNPGAAMRLIEGASRDVCVSWHPDHGPLSDALTLAFGAAGPNEPMEPMEPTEPMEPMGPVARFLATHAFACWSMYDGRGIRGALDWLLKARTALHEERRACPDLKEAFRRADLSLRHRV